MQRRIPHQNHRSDWEYPKQTAFYMPLGECLSKTCCLGSWYVVSTSKSISKKWMLSTLWCSIGLKIKKNKLLYNCKIYTEALSMSSNWSIFSSCCHGSSPSMLGIHVAFIFIGIDLWSFKTTWSVIWKLDQPIYQPNIGWGFISTFIHHHSSWY